MADQRHLRRTGGRAQACDALGDGFGIVVDGGEHRLQIQRQQRVAVRPQLRRRGVPEAVVAEVAMHQQHRNGGGCAAVSGQHVGRLAAPGLAQRKDAPGGPALAVQGTPPGACGAGCARQQGAGADAQQGRQNGPQREHEYTSPYTGSAVPQKEVGSPRTERDLECQKTAQKASQHKNILSKGRVEAFSFTVVCYTNDVYTYTLSKIV